MMYWLLNEHHILPGTYWALPEGEKLIIQSIYVIEMEGRRQRNV